MRAELGQLGRVWVCSDGDGVPLQYSLFNIYSRERELQKIFGLKKKISQELCVLVSPGAKTFRESRAILSGSHFLTHFQLFEG